jgi:hypothetical protein
VDVGGICLPRLTSLLLVIGIGILNRTLGFGAVGELDVGSLCSVTMDTGSVVTRSMSLVASGVGVAGTSWLRFSVDGSSSGSASSVVDGRRLQSGL